MNKFLKTFLVLIVISLLAIGCKEEDNPTDPGNGDNNSNSNPTGQPIPEFGDPDGNGLMATIGYSFATMPGLPSVDLNMAFATFGDGVDAGQVEVNGNELGKTTSEGSTFYMAPDFMNNPTATLSGVNFNGSQHSWIVSGGNGIPAMSGSTVSPSQFNITAPANNATVSKGSGIAVNWTGSSNARVLIVLASQSGSGYYISSELNDSGSYTIPASELGSISGQSLLQVVKYHYADVSASGKNYYIITEIVKSNTITVQ